MKFERFVDRSNPNEVLMDKEANWFAYAFLMPLEEFKEVYKKYDGNEFLIASHFLVSVEAVKVRIKIMNKYGL